MERESHLIMKEIIKHKITHNVNRLKTSLKWVVFAILSGVLVGSVGTLFYLCMALVTLVRTKNPWLIFLLPVGGILIVGAYRLLHDERDTGTNLVLSAIHSGDELPLRMAPLIFISTLITHLFGGSADLAPSNKTNLKGEGDFSKADYSGKNLHFGVREQAMTAIGNGLVLHGGVIPYVATFFVFSDYMKPIARLSSLMKVPLIYVLTHDSIGVGEDGPTHEPIEQLAMLRAQPNFHVFRPADAKETAAAWYSAITSEKTPTALVLTRQNLPQLAGTGRDAVKGAYIVADSAKETPDAIIIATGSELSLAVEAKELLLKDGMDVRVVSMPCMDLFEEQSPEYKESVLPKAVRKRVAVEALSDFGWGRYVGLDGATVCMEGFGASGPAAQLFKKFGFTAERVAETVKSL